MSRSLTPDRQQFDPFLYRPSVIGSIVFFESRSRSFNTVLSVARRSKRFIDVIWEGRSGFALPFTRDRNDLTRAKYVIENVLQWKGSLLFIRGNLQSRRDAYRVVETMSCFIQASDATDPLSHCLTPVKHFSLGPECIQKGAIFPKGESSKLVLPCRLLHPYSHLLEPKLKPSLENQVESLAIRQGCSWCPNFKKGNLSSVS